MEPERRGFSGWLQSAGEMHSCLTGVFTLVLLFFAVGPASAETVAECHARLKDPVECFLTNAAFQLKMCSLQIELATLKGAENSSCISEGKRDIERFYEPANQALAKRSASSSSLLKDAYAFWQTSMDSLLPERVESEAIYKRRLADRERGFNEKANRVRAAARAGEAKRYPIPARKPQPSSRFDFDSPE